jgi:hypothetical protein
MSSKFLLSDNNKRRFWFAFFTFIFMYAGLAYGLIGKLYVDRQLYAYEQDGHPYVSDFANAYNAGALARECLSHRINVYDREIQDQSLRRVIAPVVPESPFYCQYPPYFFVLTLPLAFVDINAAWLVWTGLAVLLIALITPSLLKYRFDPLSGNLLPPEKLFTARSALITALIFSTFPAWYAVKLGQPVLYTYTALVYLLTRLYDNAAFRAGMAGLIVFVKLQYAPVLMIVGVVWGRLRFFLGAAAAAALLLALSAFLLGGDSILNYPAVLLAGETGDAVSGVAAEVMQNVRGQLILWFGSTSPVVRYGTLAAFALALPVVLGLWLRFKKADAELAVDKDASVSQFQLVASFTILLMLATSLHTHYQDYLLATIPCIWIWNNNIGRPGKSKRTIALLIMVLGFVPFSWLAYVLSTKMPMIVQPFFAWNIIVQLLLLPDLLAKKRARWL